MAKVTFKNGDDYIAKLSKLSGKAKTNVIGPAIYSGADVVTNEIRDQLEKMPTDESYGTPSKPAKGISKYQKEGLLRSLGVASMQDDGGFLNVKIGFDGYNGIATKRWPKGQPNQMVARAAESGTSWMRKNQPIKKAISKSKNTAITAMKETADKNIEKIMKG